MNDKQKRALRKWLGLPKLERAKGARTSGTQAHGRLSMAAHQYSLYASGHYNLPEHIKSND